MLSAFWRTCADSRIRVVGVVLGLSSLWLSSIARSEDHAWAKRLPKESAIVWHYGGSESQREAFEKTANFEAFYRSGLMSALQKAWAGISQESFSAQLMSDNDPETIKRVFEAAYQLYRRGFTTSVCFPDDDQDSWPYVLFMVPDAAQHAAAIGAWAEAETKSALAKRGAAAKDQPQEKEERKPKVRKDDDANDEDSVKEKSEDKTKSESVKPLPTNSVIGYETIVTPNRTIYCQHSRWGTAKMDWACWADGGDLLVYFGRPGVAANFDKAMRAGSLTSSPSWQRAWPELDQPIAETSRAWCDVTRLLKRYGSTPIPGFPNEFTVERLLKPIGFDEIESVAWRTGYHNRHLVDVWDVVIPQPRKGLLALYDQPTVSLDHVPPLPASLRSFSIQAVNVSRTWDQFGEILSEYGSHLPPETTAWFQQITHTINGENAADVRRELFASLGNVFCTWSDSEQEVLSLGRFNLAISVKDEAALKRGLDHLFEHIQEQNSEFKHTSSTRHGYPFYVFAERSSIIKPSAALCDGWLIFGIQPQSVESTLLRAKGHLPRWKPDIAKTTGIEPPKAFSGLTWSDPRGTVRFAMSLLPWLADTYGSVAQQIAPGLDFSSLDIPPAELVTQPLFPNLSTTVVSPDRIRWTSWSSAQTNNSLLLAVQAYGALTIVINLVDEFPLDLLTGLFEANAVPEAAMPDEDSDEAQ